MDYYIRPLHKLFSWLQKDSDDGLSDYTNIRQFMDIQALQQSINKKNEEALGSESNMKKPPPQLKEGSIWLYQYTISHVPQKVNFVIFD